jgi:hypothetical protein
MGIHTSKADCYNPAMTIGSAADSTYEYMLKQWIMSNRTQEVSLWVVGLRKAGNGVCACMPYPMHTCVWCPATEQ